MSLSRYYVAFHCPNCGIGTRDFSVNWLIGAEIIVALLTGFIVGIITNNGGI